MGWDLRSSMSNKLVEPRLTHDQAEQLDELLSLLEKERSEQFEEQGLSSDPVSYKALIAYNPRKYLHERYLTEVNENS